MVMSFFAKGCGGRLAPVGAGGDRISCYGVLRGCMAAMKAADAFWYIDHGAFDRGRYYRVVRDGFWISSEPDTDDERFRKLNVTLKDWRTTGDHIVIVPPSQFAELAHDLVGWLDAVSMTLARYTDRPIVVHTKASKEPLSHVLQGAWCLVTDHSNAAIDALTEGIPAIMTNPARRLGDLRDIENPPMRRDFFCRLANQQWTLDEMASGECWRSHESSDPGLHRV